MKKIHTVIWDCDGVVWKNEKNLQPIAKKLEIANYEEFSKQCHEFFNKFSEYFKNKKVNMPETLQMADKIMPILGIHSIAPITFFRALRDTKLEICSFNNDAIFLMRYLQSKGIKNIIKTDWWKEIQEVVLSHYGVMEYVEELHCCNDEYLKINPKSTENLIKKGREDGYVIIGDSLKSDIAFAEHADIKSIWYNPYNKENATQMKPTYEVTSLLEVMDII